MHPTEFGCGPGRRGHMLLNTKLVTLDLLIINENLNQPDQFRVDGSICQRSFDPDTFQLDTNETGKTASRVRGAASGSSKRLMRRF